MINFIELLKSLAPTLMPCYKNEDENGTEIAQLVERKNYDREVAGSSPMPVNIFSVVSLNKVLNPTYFSRPS